MRYMHCIRYMHYTHDTGHTRHTRATRHARRTVTQADTAFLKLYWYLDGPKGLREDEWLTADDPWRQLTEQRADAPLDLKLD